MRKRRIGEHAVRYQPVAHAARAAGEVVADDAKIIDRDVRELRAASTIANCPDIGRRRLQPFVDAKRSRMNRKACRWRPPLRKNRSGEYRANSECARRRTYYS
jgi:hypothetical protein